ncbi:RNA polymerase sigma factor [Kribbella endophytica]
MAQPKADPATSVDDPSPGTPSVGNEHRQDFDDFFVDYFKRSVRAVMLAGARYEEACDAVQDAMVLAAHNYERLRTPAPWVRRVAIRIYTRKRLRAGKISQREEQASRQRTVQPPDAGELTEAVRGCLQRLPRVQRTIMALSIDGHSNAEIAEILSKPAATVRSNLRTARQAMAAGLEKGGWNV